MFPKMSLSFLKLEIEWTGFIEQSAKPRRDGHIRLMGLLA